MLLEFNPNRNIGRYMIIYHLYAAHKRKLYVLFDQYSHFHLSLFINNELVPLRDHIQLITGQIFNFMQIDRTYHILFALNEQKL